MRSIVALAIFIGAAALLVVVFGLFGGVGSVELLVALVAAAIVTGAWVYRSTHASRRASN